MANLNIPIHSEAICLLTHEFAPFYGGVATYVQEVAFAAAKLHYPVQVFTVNYQGRESTLKYLNTTQFPFPITRLASSGRLGVNGISSLIFSLVKEARKPDSSFSQAKGYVLCSAGAHMAAMILDYFGLWPKQKPTIALFHGSEVFKFTYRPFWKFFAKRFYKNRVHHFVFASRYVENLLKKHFLLESDSLKNIQRKEFHYAPCACPSFFNDLIPVQKTPSSLIRFLTVARIHPRKGQLDFVRSLGNLPLNIRQKITYSLVGTGDESYLQEIRSECTRLEVHLEIQGAVPWKRLPEAYQNCDVFVLPSRTLKQSVEGFGIVCLEASFFGKPILAFDSGGIREAVIMDKTGLLIPEGDSKAMSQAVARLYEDSALRKTLGDNGRAYAKTFSWENAAKSICGLISFSDDPAQSKPKAVQYPQVSLR